MKIPFPGPADRTYSIVLALGAALYAVTALTNQGIVAIDDYAFMTRRFLPAQNHSVASIVAAEGFRSPVPLVVHYALARLALMLGLAHPLDQLRFNLVTLGLLGFGVMAGAGHTLFAGYEEAQRRRHRTVFALLLGFYFVAPVAFTRPMIESLAAPWVLASAAAAAVYFREGRRGWLVASVVAVAIAAMMRPQAGVVFLALPAVIALRRRWWDLAALAGTAVACFAATGLVDLALTGGFHRSLREYFRFNLANSSSFGVQPWYLFVLLLLGLSLPPVFLARYRGLDWRGRYLPLLPALLMFGVFLLAHSVVPHKEERFVIPVLPIFFVLLTPLAVHLLDATGQRWRVVFFAVANGIALVLLVSSPIQRTVLGVAGWLDHHPEIRTVLLAQNEVLMPWAYIAHPVARRVGLTESELAGEGPADCSKVVVSLAASEVTDRVAASGRYRPVARFSPGPLEMAVVWLNPRHNARRGPILVFAPAGC
jgi:hypothetical protein